MDRKRFTEEEMTILRENPYTYKVTPGPAVTREKSLKSNRRGCNGLFENLRCIDIKKVHTNPRKRKKSYDTEENII